MDSLYGCKDLNSLKRIVASQLNKRSLDPEVSWTVIAIDQSTKDVQFCSWLGEAIRLHSVLKRRSRITLLKSLD